MMTSGASFTAALFLTACALASAPVRSAALPATLERVALTPDKRALARQPSGRPFVPWGFNYDRDYKLRLIEDYWIAEWDTVAADFREMKALGANIVRIHLSVGRFLEGPDQPDQKNLAQLARLVALCEEIGIYLDVTGLGSYRKEDAPPWYVNTDEAKRWAIQARFWEAIAATCAKSPAIAWYNLMNEPIVPGEKRKPGEWMAGFLAKFWYCQFITLDPAGRERADIARAWIRQMSAAIREHDQEGLITVGLLPVSGIAGEMSFGFEPRELKDVLDLICVHVYPNAPPFEKEKALLKYFDVGRPLVIEEIFPLGCSPEDLPAFIQASRKHVDGWIGFYWGQTPGELAPSTQPLDVTTNGWLKVFQENRPADSK